MANNDVYDVAVLFTQDRDLNEAVVDLIEARDKLNRWIYVDSAFCFKTGAPRHLRIGLPNAHWFKIDKAMYDSCIDYDDYRIK